MQERVRAFFSIAIRTDVAFVNFVLVECLGSLTFVPCKVHKVDAVSM